MLSNEKLIEYAKLALEVGVNLQKGQKVVIRADVQSAFFVHILVKTAYELGSDKVYVAWRDEVVNKLDIDFCNDKELDVLCDYETNMWDYYIKQDCAFVSVISENPNNYSDCDSKRVNRYMLSTRKSRKNLLNSTMTNNSRWTIVAVPSAEWAKTVFPDDSESVAVDKLWDTIAQTVRLDCDDPVKAWREHIAVMAKRAEWLTEKNFEYVRFTSKNGTDLKVGLAIGHVWISADEAAQDKVHFVANMPTEEVFTAPHRTKVDGVVHNALPLVDNGAVMDNFSLTFKNGKVVSFTAEKGYEGLKSIIETDEGSSHIGEVSLIGKNSPISNSGLLFYNTLFDENASCHIALGQAYPTTVKNGNDLSEKEQLKVGLNKSLMHVDFMIGTKDTNVEGIGFDGSVTKIFEDGEWVI